MKNQKEILPPRWARRLLEWYCRPDLLEDLQGDLNEYFHRHCRQRGLSKARLIYILDVFKFFRSYTIRKPEFLTLFIQWIMLHSYVKTSMRSLVRHKLFSFINIAGLAISMAVGLLMIGLLSDMAQYDEFHENKSRIYRVISKQKHLDSNESKFASTSLRAGYLLEESTTGIEKVAIMRGGIWGDVKTPEKTITSLQGYWANESFLSVFTFPMTNGKPALALKEPFSVVLTEQTAKKLFGETDPMGKTIKIPSANADASVESDFTVTGIMKDIPAFSHMKFDLLASFSTFKATASEHEFAWNYIWMNYVYVLLPEKADLANIQTTLNNISNRENLTMRKDPNLKDESINLSFQPLSEIAMGDDLGNSIGPVMTSSHVWVIGLLSFIVILSACFNYTNLSIARSLSRAREVGIRKVVGALKNHVMGQLIVESILIALFALVFSFSLFLLLRPWFLSLDTKYQDMLRLDLSVPVIGYFILLAIVIGIMAGFFPALFFARVNAIKMLKNISTSHAFKGVSWRKALVVVQFTISLMFISAAIIGYKHYKQVIAFDLGFNTENILNIRLYGNNPELLRNQLTEMPEVKGISKSDLTLSLGNAYAQRVRYNGDSASILFNNVDENYIHVLGHTLLAGRSFNHHAEGTTPTEVIVNEKVLKRFNIGNQDPRQAIGEVLTVGEKLQIVGVVKDFYYGKSLDGKMEEVIFKYVSARPQYMNVKVVSSDWPATLAKIETAWKKIDDVHPLKATFYNEQIEASYQEFSARIKVIGALSFLAICIASIGLFGMVVFTTETRLKEISIRKVMGATDGNLVFLMSRGFLLLLGISTVIALPLTHYFFVNYALDKYANRAPMALNELTMGVTAVMAIAFLMIGSQTLKVARSNPARVLKNE